MDSNVNLNSQSIISQTGSIGTFPELGVFKTIVLVPKGTIIPLAQMVDNATFATYVNAKFINDTYTSQWFGLTKLDEFKDETAGDETWDTGIYKTNVYSHPKIFGFLYLQSMGNFIEITGFKNAQTKFDMFIIDDLGNWHGTLDQTGLNGLQAYDMMQFWVGNPMPRTTKTGLQFPIRVSLALQKETADWFKVYQANYSADNITMLQNATLTDVSSIIVPAAPTTTISFVMKSGQDSYDLVRAYSSVLTAACFVCTNLTVGGTVITATPASITTGTNVVAGETYYWVKAVMSAAPTAGNIVRISLAAPSVVNAIIPNFNCVSPSINNVNGSNCCIHTF